MKFQPIGFGPGVTRQTRTTMGRHDEATVTHISPGMQSAHDQPVDFFQTRLHPTIFLLPSLRVKMPVMPAALEILLFCNSVIWRELEFAPDLRRQNLDSIWVSEQKTDFVKIFTNRSCGALGC